MSYAYHFWDFHGVVKIDFIDKNTRIKSQYDVEILRETRSCRKAPIFKRYILHDNTAIHTSQLTKSEIEKLSIEAMPHPPYSLDLAPSDFFLFLHLKSHQHGHRFTDPEGLKEKVKSFFDMQTENVYENAFYELEKRWKKYVEFEISYNEKY